MKSSQARNKINQWFKSQFKEENILKGKELVDKYCKSKSINFPEISKPELIEKVLRKYGFRDWDAVLAAIGHGGLKEGQVVNKLQEEYDKKNAKLTDAAVLESLESASASPSSVASVSAAAAKAAKGKAHTGIVVKGLHDLSVRCSRCCNPVPGDEIIGFVTRGRGISIHRTDCINILNLPEMERARLIDAEWEQPESGTDTELFTAEIVIYAHNRIGIFVDVSKIFTERKIDITSMNVRTSKQGMATITMTFDTKGVEELNQLIAKLMKVESVIDIERAGN